MPAGFLIHPVLTSSPSSPQQTAPSAPLAFQSQMPKSSPAPTSPAFPPTPDPGTVAALHGCPRAHSVSQTPSVCPRLPRRGQTACRAKCALSAPQLETGHAARLQPAQLCARSCVYACMYVCACCVSGCAWVCMQVHACVCARVHARVRALPHSQRCWNETPPPRAGEASTRRPGVGGG